MVVPLPSHPQSLSDFGSDTAPELEPLAGSSLERIQSRIRSIRATLPAHVEIMAVTKGVGLEGILAAYQAGIRHFGESRVQEAKHKREQLPPFDQEVYWHLIGHLQANKVKPALQLFDWIDSVDSLKLAQIIQQRAWELDRVPQLCLQVKLIPDPQKHGWSMSELLQALPQLSQLSQLHIRGLMTIPPQGLSAVETLEVFKKLRELGQHIHGMGDPQLDMQVLSMGMSNDYLQAVEAGATLVRLGHAIFSE